MRALENTRATLEYQLKDKVAMVITAKVNSTGDGDDGHDGTLLDSRRALESGDSGSEMSLGDSEVDGQGICLPVGVDSSEQLRAERHVIEVATDR